MSRREPAQCYYESSPDGAPDRLKRWSSVSWNIPNTANPGFHVRTVNPFLEKYLPRLVSGMSAPEEETVNIFVPLCGKSVDMPFLCEQGFGVVGVEGVRRPIVEFQSEQRVRVKGQRQPVVVSQGPAGWADGSDFAPATEWQGARRGYVFKTGDRGLGYYSETPALWRMQVPLGRKVAVPLHLVQGDFFEVTPELVGASTFVKSGSFDAVWDRGSLVAIPPSAREEYAATISRLVRPGGRILLVVVDYDQSLVPVDSQGRRRSPPPFSVSQADVRRLYPASGWTVELLESRVDEELPLNNQSFRGVAVNEVVYLLTKRTDNESGSSWTLGKVCIGGVAVAALGAVLATFYGRN